MAIDTSKMKQMGEKVKVKDRAATISAKHLLKIQNNAKLKPCCQDAASDDVEFFQTPNYIKNGGKPAGADLMVMTCSCGLKQTIMGGGGAAGTSNPDGQIA